MTEEEYEIKTVKIRNKMNQMTKNASSYDLSFSISDVDIEKDLAILGEEIEELKNYLEVEDFLNDVNQLLIKEGYLKE